MAKLDYSVSDKTLLEIDKALELKKSLESPRHYLGLSEVGHECQRYLFYSFRNAAKREFSAKGVRAVEDGHTQELIMIERLRMLPYIELYTVDPDDNTKQIGCEFLLSHMKGHCDGIIRGILEAPKSFHIWEHKSCNEDKFKTMLKLKVEKGEKDALIDFDIIYYTQAQMYMMGMNVESHYMTISTPGGREYTSCRTDFKKSFADNVIEKAQSIIFDNFDIPSKLSQKREFFKCGYCQYKGICHDGDIPEVHCKSCRYRRAEKDGMHYCELKEETIEKTLLNIGCPDHIFNPALIPVAEFVEHQDWAAIYRIKDKDLYFANCGRSDFPKGEGQIDAIFTSKQLHDQIKNIHLIEKNTQPLITMFKGEPLNDDEVSRKAWDKAIDPRLEGI